MAWWKAPFLRRQADGSYYLAVWSGSCLRQVVPDLPKPMAPVAGRPFLKISLISLARNGFRRVVLSPRYLADRVVSHFGDSFTEMDLVYEIEQAPMGTGGAVRQSLKHSTSEHVFLFNGDTFLDFEAADVEAQWKTNRATIIMACAVPDTARYGRSVAANGGVLGFSEKGTAGPGVINADCYMLPTYILDGFLLGQAFLLETDVLVKAVTTQRIDMFVTNSYFIDIGVPEDYTRAKPIWRVVSVLDELENGHSRVALSLQQRIFDESSLYGGEEKFDEDALRGVFQRIHQGPLADFCRSAHDVHRRMPISSTPCASLDSP